MGVSYGSPATASAALFGRATNATKAYVAESINKFMSYASGIPLTVSHAIMEKHQELINIGLSRKVEALRHKLNGMWEDDCIRPLHSVGAIQQAPDVMVRWIMANERLRGYYHDGRVEGYGERYIDREPGRIGNQQYDYRRVMDGGVVIDKNNRATYANYYEEHIDNDVVLNVIERNIMRVAYDIIDDSIEEGNQDDPSSGWNGLIS